MTALKGLMLAICCNALAATAYSSYYDRSDSYGVYRYSSYGGKKYTRCYDRYASTLDLCRPSSYGRYNNRYDDRYDRNYNGRSDYYGTGVNLGRGTFRILRNGRDAELSCEFPRGSHLISNVIWERADRGRGRQSYYNDYRRSSLNLLGHRSSVRRLGDYGSILTIRDYDSSADSGLYRCTATRSYSGYSSGYSGSRESVYMEVDFRPRYEDNYYGRNSYDNYFSRYDRYDRYDRDRPYYGYAYAKTSEDTAVVDNAIDDKNTEDKESGRQ